MPFATSRYFRLNAGLAFRIVVIDFALFDCQSDDLDARLFVLLIAVQQPVPAAACTLLKKNGSMAQVQFWHDDLPSDQAWQVERELQRVRGNHLFFFRPGWVGERYIRGADARQRPA